MLTPEVNGPIVDSKMLFMKILQRLYLKLAPVIQYYTL